LCQPQYNNVYICLYKSGYNNICTYESVNLHLRAEGEPMARVHTYIHIYLVSYTYILTYIYLK